MEPLMIRNEDIIMFGLQPWDIEIGSNFKNMALELSKNNRVLYVNHPVNRSSLIQDRNNAQIKNRIQSLKYGEKVLEQVSEKLWVFNPRTILESVNWIPSSFLFDRFNYINNKRLVKEIQWASEKLDFNEPIIIVDNDFLRGFYFKELLKNKLFIFYIRDYLLSQPYFRKHGNRLEPEMIRKADMVAANSGYLADYARQFNPEAFDIGQGCDVKDFLHNFYQKPADLHGIKKPVIGYCGALLSIRLDINLLIQLAQRNPQWNFVLIGPEDESFRNSKLHHFKNVFFLGTKPAGELPAYIHHFDVCINPQVLNQMTIGNYPRKVDEYLAAGKQVVATSTKTMEMFSNYVYLCKDADEYISAIHSALGNADSVAKINAGRNFAMSHTWEAVIDKLYERIEHISLSKSSEKNQKEIV
jgi:glycosyltransferase involved in cell wall biosynthesis